MNGVAKMEYIHSFSMASNLMSTIIADNGGTRDRNTAAKVYPSYKWSDQVLAKTSNTVNMIRHDLTRGLAMKLLRNCIQRSSKWEINQAKKQ